MIASLIIFGSKKNLSPILLTGLYSYCRFKWSRDSDPYFKSGYDAMKAKIAPSRKVNCKKISLSRALSSGGLEAYPGILIVL
jgi:hypothetical protein